MKTIGQALIDEIHIPIPFGYIENVCIKRNLDVFDDFDYESSKSEAYKGALADCLMSLVQAVNFSESDKSIGSLTEDQRQAITLKANALYKEIGESEIPTRPIPTVYINC